MSEFEKIFLKSQTENLKKATDNLKTSIEQCLDYHNVDLNITTEKVYNEYFKQAIEEIIAIAKTMNEVKSNG